MAIIDAQVHCYERDKPERPWHAVLPGPPEVTGADMVASMGAVGVDGGILVSPYTMYRFDASYALEVHKQFPGKFGLVKPLDSTDEATDEVVAEWAAIDGTCGLRVMMAHGAEVDPKGPGIARIMRAAARHGMPVNLLCWGVMDQAAGIAADFPDTQLVIDHLGLQQPFAPPAPEAPFAELPAVMALAEKPNVAIKITGACTLSRTGYPYDDIWDPVCRLIDAFGIDRAMWGTDWTRAVNVLTYAEGVIPFRQTDRFSDSDRAKLMGGTATKVYGWAPAG